MTDHAVAYAIVPGEVTLLDKSYREYAGEKLTAEYSTDKAQQYYQQALPGLDRDLFSGARIITRDDSAASAMISAIMQEWQREFGFYCVVETLSESDFNARLSSGDFEIAMPGPQRQHQQPCRISAILYQERFRELLGIFQRGRDPACELRTARS